MIRKLLLILLLPFISYSQENEKKKSRFPLFELSKGDDNTKNSNWGNFHFSNESYSKALERYLRIDNPSVEIQRNMALAFKEIDSINSSMKLFETIINNEKDVKPVDYLNLSQLQDMNGMYKEANKNRKKYSRERAREVRVSLFETDDDYYQNLLNTISAYDLKNLEINTELSDFGGYAVRSSDGKDESIKMVFASSGIQNSGKLSRSKYIRPEKPTFNLFNADFTEDSLFSSNAKIVTGDNMNTAFQDGPAIISEDGEFMYFTRSGLKPGRDNAIHLNLYIASIMKDGTLSKVRNLLFSEMTYYFLLQIPILD